MLEHNVYDVLFTDIGLPGMSDLELAQQVTALNHKMEINFSTGMGEQTDAIQAIDAVTLIRPYNMEKMADALR